MTQNLLFAHSSTTAFAIANHLWQSTLFAAAAAVVVLAFRKNQARIRYRLWLAASLKFLVPFSLLASAGGSLAQRYLPANRPGSWLAAVRAMGQPFTLHITVLAHPAKAAYVLYLLAGSLWLCGCVAVFSRWCVRWRRVDAARRSAALMMQGRELDALRQVERAAGLNNPMALLQSETRLEPGVFGIVQPVLLWPAAISAQLQDGHLRSILAHEVAHVKRRDNLWAAIHMAVEAIFWFHPLVWWLEVRLVEERERACDETVLLQGHAPQVYAEGILKICAFCVGSPFACVSGVTGAELKNRVMQIMAPQVTGRLSGLRKLLLASFGVAAVAAPVALGVLNASLVIAQSPAASPDTPRHIYRVGGDVSAPKLIYEADPEFSEEAKRVKYQGGVCVLTLVVDEQGHPQDIKIARHLKYGLDEKAVEALKQYKFQPAMLRGQPVAVQVNIEMNFRRY